MGTPAPPILYATVSGDILGTFRQWREGTRDLNTTAVAYSAQFYDLCRALDRPGVALGVGEVPGRHEEGDLTVVVEPLPPRRSGLAYHLVMLARGLGVFREARWSGAGDLIVMDGAGYWFPLALLGRKPRIFLSVHTVLWREGTRPGLLRRLVLAAESWFLRNRCAGALAVSEEIAGQLREMARGAPVPVQVFRPSYVAEDFAGFVAADPAQRPFRILFAGRTEPSKGVFDLLAIAEQWRAEGRTGFHIDILGEGSALSELRRQVAERGLERWIDCPGHVGRREMLERLAACHCVVVPTRSAFPEGFNKVIIEAVLARRPVVSSRVCPALRLVEGAAMEAEPDNPASYARALAALMDDPALYRAKVEASATLGAEFADPARGWGAAARALIEDAR